MVERESTRTEKIVESLIGRVQSVEVIKVPQRGRIYLLHNTNGIETNDLLDSSHMPRITKFTDVIISDAFSDLRSEAEDTSTPVNVVPSDPDLLELISTIANLPGGKGYDLLHGGDIRRVDLNAMSQAMKKLYKVCPVGEDDLVVPVKRCGENIAREIGITGFPSEAKRLRFDGGSNVLGAGGDFDLDYLSQFAGKNVRLCEGIGAAGTTQILYMSAFRNWGIGVKSLSGDFVVSCPAGARLVEEVRKSFGVKAQDNACFSVGILNQDWYVTYPDGRQVMGDGGDLTSL